MNIYINSSNSQYDALFSRIGPVVSLLTKDVDLVVFTGGTDVYPLYYGEAKGPFTDEPDIARDLEEQAIFNWCVKRNVPMVGICRGAQFLCVMNGGKLHQHDESGIHLSSHPIFVTGEEKVELIAAANHHQIMRPHSSGEVLAYYENDPEVVMWPITLSLGHQPHPEWMEHSAPYVKFFLKTVEDLLEMRYPKGWRVV